jgi:hypothetical protein
VGEERERVRGRGCVGEGGRGREREGEEGSELCLSIFISLYVHYSYLVEHGDNLRIERLNVFGLSEGQVLITDFTRSRVHARGSQSGSGAARAKRVHARDGEKGQQEGEKEEVPPNLLVFQHPCGDFWKSLALFPLIGSI